MNNPIIPTNDLTTILETLDEHTRTNIVDGLSGMTVEKGYLSNQDVLFNTTYDTIFINQQKLNGVAKFIDKIVCDDFIEQARLSATEFYSNELKPLKKTAMVVQGFTYSHLLKVAISEDDCVQKKINKTIEYIAKTLSGDDPLLPRKAQLSKTLPLAYIDWERIFSSFSDLELTTLLIKANAEEQFTLPTDSRSSDVRAKVKSEQLSLGDFINHPMFQLIKLLKPRQNIQGWDLAELNEDTFANTLEAYFGLFSQTNKSSRNAFCSFIQVFKSCIEKILLKMSIEGMCYFPFSYAFKNKVNPSFIHSLEGDLFQVAEHLVNTDVLAKSPRAVFIRGITISSNIRSIADIPLRFSELNSIAMQEAMAKKGYQTSKWFPHATIKKIISHVESTNQWLKQKGFVEFDQTYLNNQSLRIMKHSDKKREDGRFVWATGIISDNILNECRKFVSLNMTKHDITSLNCFLDWIISISDTTQLNALDDFKPNLFHDPLLESEISSTFYQFILKRVDATSSRKKVWRTVDKLFDKWAKLASYNSEKIIKSPIMEAANIFGKDDVRDITTREAMPSSLYQFCLDVLTENDYEIVSEILPNSVVTIRNNITGELDKNITIKTTGHLLHFVLLLPVRGYQGRWLCEGLLDKEIWDYEQQSYIHNTHLLADFIYDDGKSHSQRHGRTGVYTSSENHGNENLSLYISTNKTKSSSTILSSGKMGYELPWPHDSELPAITEVWGVIEKQKLHNKTYAPPMKVPVCVLDDDDIKFEPKVRKKLPFFAPLFRRYTPSVSKTDPQNRRGLYLPITGDSLRKLFRGVLKKAEARYKAKYPQFENSIVAFDHDGNPLYDIHALRVYGITALLDSGIPAEVVQMIVGHDTVIMTMYYYKKQLAEYKKLLITAKKKQGGLAISNEKDFLALSSKDKQELIALFDLVSEWRSTDKLGNKSITMRPNFSGGGKTNVINGGVCNGFDCKTGGIAVEYEKNGATHKVTPVQGGDFRCGNCRYWRTGPRFLAEQIHYLNVVATEIQDLITEHRNLIEKSNEIYEDSTKVDGYIVAERMERQADELTATIAHRVVELERREIMYDECKVQDVGNANARSLPVTLENKNHPKWETVGIFNATMEVATQAAVLAVPESVGSVSIRKLNKFINQVTSLSGAKNPFLFMPDDNTKNLAILYKLADAAEMIGRSFTDEEFENPLLLIKSLGESKLNNLGNSLSSVENFLLENGENK